MPDQVERLREENARLRRRVVELEAVLRQARDLLAGAMPRRTRGYDDPDDVLRRMREERAAPPPAAPRRRGRKVE